MIADQFQNWKVGSYKGSFPDLAVAGKDLEALELDDVEKFISTEAVKGAEVFEAFGMKFPAGQITAWGIAIVLAIQLYFFIYLKQLFGKLDRTDAGWDVPWIGMDTSLLAQIIFGFTVIGVPVFAVLVLVGAELFRVHGPFASKPSLALGMLVASLPLYPAAFLGILCWNYRPKTKAASTSFGPEKPPMKSELPATSSSSTPSLASTTPVPGTESQPNESEKSGN